MADFDKLGDLDLPQAQEASEEASERFQERVAVAQAALKQIKKDEAKHKKQDNHLVKIITYFLQTAGNTDLANLIAALVEKDTPSDFILAILSLVDTQSKDVILAKKEELLLKNGGQSTQALISVTANDWEKFSPEIKAEIDAWFKHIYLIAQQETEKIMEKTLDKNLTIDPNILQLMAILLQKFLTKKTEKIEYDQIFTFVKLALQKVYEKLQVEYAEKLHLSQKN